MFTFVFIAVKDNSSEINEILKYVEENFSDVLFPKGIVTKLELIGKGTHIHISQYYKLH